MLLAVACVGCVPQKPGYLHPVSVPFWQRLVSSLRQGLPDVSLQVPTAYRQLSSSTTVVRSAAARLVQAERNPVRWLLDN